MNTPKNTSVRERFERIWDKGPEAVLDAVAKPYRRESDLSTPEDHARFELGDQLERVLDYLVDTLGIDKAEPQIRALLRYALEGGDPDQASIYVRDERPLELVKAMAQKRFTAMDIPAPLADLGCGPAGPALAQWDADTGIDGLSWGMDLSPSFALRSYPRTRVGLIDAPAAQFADQLGPNNDPVRVSFSSLTLDRLRDPRQLIENMAEWTLPGGIVAIGTLLPIVGSDDGPNVNNPIVYTPKENEIVPGQNPEQDRRLLTEYLEDRFRSKVSTQRVPYTCQSSDGTQVYDNYWLFTLSTQ